MRRDFDPCLIATFNMDAVIPVLIFTAGRFLKGVVLWRLGFSGR